MLTAICQTLFPVADEFFIAVAIPDLADISADRDLIAIDQFLSIDVFNLVHFHSPCGITRVSLRGADTLPTPFGCYLHRVEPIRFLEQHLVLIGPVELFHRPVESLRRLFQVEDFRLDFLSSTVCLFSAHFRVPLFDVRLPDTGNYIGILFRVNTTIKRIWKIIWKVFLGACVLPSVPFLGLPLTLFGLALSLALSVVFLSLIRREIARPLSFTLRCFRHSQGGTECHRTDLCSVQWCHFISLSESTKQAFLIRGLLKRPLNIVVRERRQVTGALPNKSPIPVAYWAD